MANIELIAKIKQKNAGTFKLLDASDINWDIALPSDKLPAGTVTTTQMNTAINQAVANAHHLKRVVLDADTDLPTTGDADTIYMKPKTGSAGDVYDEYMWINNAYERIGSSNVDLTNYATKSYVDSKGSDTLTQAKTYADTQTNAAKTAAATDASTKANNALTEAKKYTDQEKAKYLPLTGGTMTGKLTGIVTPENESDAVNKKYVDDVVQQTTPQGLLTQADFNTGKTNGTFAVKDKEVKIAGLGSAAYINVEDIAINWNSIG